MLDQYLEMVQKEYLKKLAEKDPNGEAAKKLAEIGHTPPEIPSWIWIKMEEYGAPSQQEAIEKFKLWNTFIKVNKLSKQDRHIQPYRGIVTPNALIISPANRLIHNHILLWAIWKGFITIKERTFYNWWKIMPGGEFICIDKKTRNNYYTMAESYVSTKLYRDDVIERIKGPYNNILKKFNIDLHPRH